MWRPSVKHVITLRGVTNTVGQALGRQIGECCD